MPCWLGREKLGGPCTSQEAARTPPPTNVVPHLGKGDSCARSAPLLVAGCWSTHQPLPASWALGGMDALALWGLLYASPGRCCSSSQESSCSWGSCSHSRTGCPAPPAPPGPFMLLARSQASAQQPHTWAVLTAPAAAAPGWPQCTQHNQDGIALTPTDAWSVGHQDGSPRLLAWGRDQSPTLPTGCSTGAPACFNVGGGCDLTEALPCAVCDLMAVSL